MYIHTSVRIYICMYVCTIQSKFSLKTLCYALYRNTFQVSKGRGMLASIVIIVNFDTQEMKRENRAEHRSHNSSNEKGENKGCGSRKKL